VSIETKPTDAELIAECQAEEDAANATRLPCGSCGEPQPIGTANCSACGMPPAWIVEPCDFCKGSPGLVSAPAGWSDFSGGGCPKCDSGWIPTTCAGERSAAWQAWAETLTGDASEPLELFEVGDDLPDPADEYARREGSLRSRLRFRVAYREVATGVVGVGRAEMSREVARRMIERENERDPRFVRWLVPDDAHAVRVYDREQADLTSGRPLLDHRGEVVGREIERPLLFEEPEEDETARVARLLREHRNELGEDDPDEEGAALDSKIRLSEKIWTKLVADKRRAEELLGEIIEYCEEDGHYKAWVVAARPFARFREAK
jgi:hypothetical protein